MLNQGQGGGGRRREKLWNWQLRSASLRSVAPVLPSGMKFGKKTKTEKQKGSLEMFFGIVVDSELDGGLIPAPWTWRFSWNWKWNGTNDSITIKWPVDWCGSVGGADEEEGGYKKRGREGRKGRMKQTNPLTINHYRHNCRRDWKRVNHSALMIPAPSTRANSWN